MNTGVQFMYEAPTGGGCLFLAVEGFLPGAPISSDQYKMLQTDNIVSPDADDLEALGITPTPLAAAARGWMQRYAEHGRFGVRAKAG